MARKPGKRAEFVLFDVVYEDGTQRSNRKVPGELLGGLDGDTPARTFIEQAVLDYEAVASAVNGAFFSAFVRATKPESR